MQRQRWPHLLALLIYILAASGCSSVSYYWQAINGHFAIKMREQPISELLQQPALDPVLRQKLDLVLRARRFASEQLALPDNDSYTQYADLQRKFVTWNVVATPEFAIEPHRWCFVFAGCFNYRGYFHQEDARALANELKQSDYDVAITGAWAYSTLGWFDDPVLNTMLAHTDSELIGTLFHELAHQTVYVDDDSSYNEAFAMTVEQEGLRRWYQQGGQPARYEKYLHDRQQRNDFFALLQHTRSQLKDLYHSGMSAEKMRQQKQILFSELKSQYQSWRTHHKFAAYDRWMAQELNNAHLALIATYTAKVPAFIAMLAAVNGDLPAFYREAKRLGEMPQAERDQALLAFQNSH